MEMQAYVHTFCFGPGTKVVNPSGKLCALTSVMQMWNCAGHPRTLYYAMDVSKSDTTAVGDWVDQQVLQENLHGWSVMEAK